MLIYYPTGDTFRSLFIARYDWIYYFQQLIEDIPLIIVSVDIYSSSVLLSSAFPCSYLLCSALSTEYELAKCGIIFTMLLTCIASSRYGNIEEGKPLSIAQVSYLFWGGFFSFQLLKVIHSSQFVLLEQFMLFVWYFRYFV